MKRYTENDLQLCKVMKLNQDHSMQLLSNLKQENAGTQNTIDSSEQLLQKLGYQTAKINQEKTSPAPMEYSCQSHPPILSEWEDLVRQADESYSYEVYLNDLFTQEELSHAMVMLDAIHSEFSLRTSITNQTDLSFLSIAIALQLTKTIFFSFISDKLQYGKSFNPSTRYKHDDKDIKDAEKALKVKYASKIDEKYNNMYWSTILTRSVPYDTISGSKILELGGDGKGMSGKNHRLLTLGHDPILGWIFGTLNILVDAITMSNFSTYRVTRVPKIIITPETIPIPMLMEEGYAIAAAHHLNLPTAVFMQAVHLKSDEYTKIGLPVPMLTSFNPELASSICQMNYDALCFARDTKIVGTSFLVSALIDAIISQVHSLYYCEDESYELFQVRTRKILLVSNSIAAGSNLLLTGLTQNPKHLDIGTLLATTSHLFRDSRFILKIKDEFIQNAIDVELQEQLDELDRL